MSETANQIKRIQEKLQALIKSQQLLRKENVKLQQELSNAQKKVTEQQHNLDELRQQVSILKAASGQMNDHDKKEFEKRINSYIKEIDRCISLLSNE
jgi:Ni,Fe-hydrogenase I large subunit